MNESTQQSTIDPIAVRAASHAARLGANNENDAAGAAAVLVPVLEDIAASSRRSEAAFEDISRTLKRIADTMEDSAP